MLAFHGSNELFKFFSFKKVISGENSNSAQLGSGFYFSNCIKVAMQYGRYLYQCDIPDSKTFFEEYDRSKNIISDKDLKYLILNAPDVDKSLENFGEVNYLGFYTVLEDVLKAYKAFTWYGVITVLSRDFYTGGVQNTEQFNRSVVKLTKKKGMRSIHNYCVFLPEDIQIKRVLDTKTNKTIDFVNL